MSKGVLTKRDGIILEITLDRPKVNAINSMTSRELAAAFQKLEDDSDLQVAILTAKGDKIFSAGWDLKADEALDEDHGPGGFAGLTELHSMTKPVIAAVNGLAIGGGFELVLACDLIVAVEEAKFSLPEATLGIIPDSGGVLRLPKKLPKVIAMEMLYTGDYIDMSRAYELGLVNRVVPRGQLMESARKLANQIAQSAPLAVQTIKAVIQHTNHLTVESGFSWMRERSQLYQQMLQSKDATEGQKAFKEKRNPHWTGK